QGDLLPPEQHLVDDLRDHVGIRLVGSEDVEETSGRAPRRYLTCEQLQLLLVGPLRQAINVSRADLTLFSVRVVSNRIDGRRGSDDKAGGRTRAQRLQQVLGADDIYLESLKWVRVAIRDEVERREMDHKVGVGVLHDFLDHPPIPEIGFAQGY